ncbi:MAG: sigma-70 family RNA polymerase sigma factor [Clostridia bacterium]|nr:sigma-70 family RNA polymerase sigma factor [Clostridia bacterium]
MYLLAQAGDAPALKSLVRQHIPLVQALCRRFSYSQDAFQQGCIGLVKAIRRFRPEAGVRFSTYAVPVILGEMKKAFSHELGWRSRAAVKKAKDYQESYFKKNGRMPSIARAADAAGVSPADLCLLLEMEKGPKYDETGDLLLSIPDPAAEKWFIRFCVRDILSRMPKDESELLSLRYFFGKTQTELAGALRVPQCSVSRKEKRARARFREAWTEAE